MAMKLPQGLETHHLFGLEPTDCSQGPVLHQPPSQPMSGRRRALQSSLRKVEGQPSLGKQLLRSGADIYLFTPRLCPVTALSGALISHQSLWRRPFCPPIQCTSQISGLLLRLGKVLPTSSSPPLSIPRRRPCDHVVRGRECRLWRPIWV